MVEIRWIESLAANEAIPEVAALDSKSKQFLEDLISNFNESEAELIKEYEKQTNHDVKAIEYYLRDKLQTHKSLKSVIGFIHFACTSEDINNVAYASTRKATLGCRHAFPNSWSTSYSNHYG
jgi:adenylosuccinate lyase